MKKENFDRLKESATQAIEHAKGERDLKTSYINIQEVRNRIKNNLETLINQSFDIKDFAPDYSDLGNSIGVAIGNLDKEEIEDLIEGIRHGLSLRNGTH